MKIYIDVIFLLNFFMSFIMLYFTSFLVKFIKKPKIYRLILSAAFTSILFVLFIYFELVLYNISFILMEMLLVVSLIIAFYPLDKKRFFKVFYILNIITFSFGGLVYGLLNLFSNSFFQGTKTNVTLKLFISATAICFVVIKVIYEILKDIQKPKKQICQVELCYNNKSIFLDSFIDTGNTLTYSDERVSIIDLKTISYFFTKEVYDILFSEEIIMDKLNKLNSKTFFSIIFSSVNNYKDSLIAFRCDYIKIENKVYYSEIIGITKNIEGYKLILNSDFGRIFYEKEN
ncbi:MAG: sigma-E processing peptidase SpoIIGA [Lachnospirales bacterium]